MRKNFLVTITFPLLVNVANVYFFFKVIMPTRYLWFNMPSKSSNNFHFAGVGYIWKAGFRQQKMTPFFLKSAPLFLKMNPIFFTLKEFDHPHQTGAEILGRLWQKEKNDLDWKVQKELDYISGKFLLSVVLGALFRLHQCSNPCVRPAKCRAQVCLLAVQQRALGLRRHRARAGHPLEDGHPMEGATGW